MATPKMVDAAYVEMLEARVKLAEAKATAAEAKVATSSVFAIKAKNGTSKKNGKDYEGFTVTGPAWGYVSRGLLAAIVGNVDECRKVLKG